MTSAHVLSCELTWINRFKLVLDDGDHSEARYHNNTNELQPDVQPLHGGVAEEHAALTLLQTPGALLLKPATKDTSHPEGADDFQDTVKDGESILELL